MPRPGKPTLASSQASGTPKNVANAVAHNEHRIDNHNAVRTDSSLSTPHALLHGARHNSPMNGNEKHAIAITAINDAAASGISTAVRCCC